MTKKKGSTKPHPVEINGKSYSSIGSAARAIGLSPKALADRLKKGLTGDELTKPSLTKATPVMIEGKTYQSLAAAGRELGLQSSLLRQRMLAGYTGKRLLMGAKPPDREPDVEVKVAEENTESEAIIGAMSGDRYFRAILFPKARKLRLERLDFPCALHGYEVSTHTTPQSFLKEWDRVVGAPSQQIIRLAIKALCPRPALNPKD